MPFGMFPGLKSPTMPSPAPADPSTAKMKVLRWRGGLKSFAVTEAALQGDNEISRACLRYAKGLDVNQFFMNFVGSRQKVRRPFA